MSDEANDAHQRTDPALGGLLTIYGMQSLCLNIVMPIAGSASGAACP